MNLKRLIKKLTIEEKVSLLSGFDNWYSKDIKRLGIPKIKMSDGSIFEGNFDNGQINGEGVAIYPNGDRYEGFFKNGKREGSGKITYKSGVTYEGQWENNNRVSD